MTDTPLMPIPISDIERMAQAIAKSGLFGMKTADQALALMLIAHAEGRHPALAARDYDIIQGRPAKKAEAMMRDFLQAGGKVQWEEMSDTRACATFSHPQGGSAKIDWDMKRAATAGLAGKPTWKQYPRQMLRSRVVSEGIRAIYPAATSGMYEPSEVADIAAMKDVTPPKAKDAYNPETGEIVETATNGKTAEPPPSAESPDLYRAMANELIELLETAKTREKFREYWDITGAEIRAELDMHAPAIYREVVEVMKTEAKRFMEAAQ